MNVDGWQKWISIGTRKSPKKTFKYVQVPVVNDIIAVCHPKDHYHRKFFDTYIDESYQPYSSKKCNFKGCSKVFPDVQKTRIHFISHHDINEHIFFDCNKCGKNFKDYRGLQNHVLQAYTNGLGYQDKKLLVAEALRKIKDKQPLDAFDCKNAT